MTRDSVTEIVRFYDFHLNKPETAAFEVTKVLDGCLRSYHGTEVNARGDGDGLWVQEWLSLDHHVAFQNSPTYPSFTARVASFASTDKIDIMHVQLQPYPAERAFAASFTEVSVATLKSESTNEALEAGLKETGLNNLWYGSVMEDSTRRQYLIVSAWESVKAFQTAMANLPSLKTLRKIAEFDTRLYRLST